MLKKLIYILILVVFASSCKTIKDKSLIGEVEELIRKDDLRTLQIRAQVHSDFPDFKQSFSTRINIAFRDSVQLSVLGPLNIPLGRLYAEPNYFVFFNTMESIAFEGKPSAENLKKVAYMDLSYNDLIFMLRAEAPSEFAKYRIFQKNEEKGETIYIDDSSVNYAEFIVFSHNLGTITQIQRKKRNDETLLNIVYSDFQKVNEFLLPMTINASIPDANGSITLKITEVSVNLLFLEPFKFEVPSSFELYRLD